MNIIDNWSNLVRLEAVVTVIIINFLSDGEGIIILRSQSSGLSSCIIESGRSSWRSGDDLGQLYDNVTPNPTGSLSGPYFVEAPGKTVIGIKGKTSNIACSIKNLGNLTVRKGKSNNGCFRSVPEPP